MDVFSVRTAIQIKEHDLWLGITFQVVLYLQLLFRLLVSGKLSKRNDDHIAITEVMAHLRRVGALSSQLDGLCEVSEDRLAHPAKRRVSYRRGNYVGDYCSLCVFR